MNKLILSCLIFCFTLFNVQLSSAGDFAEFKSLGFSPDGSIYAFEQFGIQDGSGFPYAERYFINVKNDTFVKGTPFKIRIEDENTSLGQVQKMIAEQSADLISQLNITAEYLHLAAFNPSTERSGDPLKISYHPVAYEPNTLSPFEVSLEMFDTTAQPPCSDFMQSVRAFRLNLNKGSDDVTKTIYEDATIPKSRNCPIEYRMGGVVTFDDYENPSVHVFLVLVKSYGFEGPDGRWIAIPKVMN